MEGGAHAGHAVFLSRSLSLSLSLSHTHTHILALFFSAELWLLSVRADDWNVRGSLFYFFARFPNISLDLVLQPGTSRRRRCRCRRSCSSWSPASGRSFVFSRQSSWLPECCWCCLRSPTVAWFGTKENSADGVNLNERVKAIGS